MRRIRITFAVLIFFLGGTLTEVRGALNAWTNSTSGYWEEPHWSLGILPAMNQTGVVLTNAGFKALAIGPGTTRDHSGSLTISNLILSAPPGSQNTLLLNFSGTTTPLHVLNLLEVGLNARVVNLGGRLVVDGTNSEATRIDGSFMQAEGGQTTLRDTIAGLNAEPEFTMSNGFFRGSKLVLGAAHSGTFTQHGGTNAIDAISLRGGSMYKLYGGSVSGTALESGYQLGVPNSGITSRFEQHAGEVIISNIGLGMGQSGIYSLFNGFLNVSNLNVSGWHVWADFYQGGGTNTCDQLTIYPSEQGVSKYWMTNGTLYSGQVTLGARLHANANFVHYGGRHRAGSIAVSGYFDDYEGIGSAGYELWGDILEVGDLSAASFGGFTQRGGSNVVSGTVSLNGLGRYTLFAGVLQSSNVVLGPGWLTGVGEVGPTMTQTGGLHQVQRELRIGRLGKYQLEGGTLNIPEISVNSGAMVRTGGTVQDCQRVTLTGSARLASTGQQESFGVLVISNTPGLFGDYFDHPAIEFLSNVATVVRFDSSRHISWAESATLFVTNWVGSTNGGGPDQLFFGQDGNGLNAQQLAHVVFINPGGLPAGAYPARILNTGEVVPMNAGPRLAYRKPGRSFVLNWPAPFYLQSTTNLAPPITWMTIGPAGSSYTNDLDKDPHKFFRIAP